MLGAVSAGKKSSVGRAYSSSVGAVVKRSNTPYGDMLARIADEQREYYDQQYRPVAQQLIKDTQSTEIVDAATKVASADNTAQVAARSNRQKLRLGIATDGAGAALGEYRARLSRTAQGDGGVNNARVVQDERNTALTNDLVGISRGIASDSMNGMQNSVSNEAARNSTNDAIKAQNQAQKNQLLGSAASLGLMALFL